MLAEIDLTAKVSNKEYKKEIEGLNIRISGLSRKAKELNIPVILIFEGWSAAGKGTTARIVLPAATQTERVEVVVS